jgi:putative nucleotidyltransferase-like protein
MARPFSAELRLAAACAMWPPSDRRTEAVRTEAAGPLDWPRFLRVTRRHQVIALAHDGLTRAGTDVPPEIAREIGTQAETVVRENLAIACEALRLQQLFDDAALPVLFVKGAPLAVLAFGNLGLRESQDIDLLVPGKTLPAATILLERAGYRRFDPPTDISDTQFRLLLPLRKDLGFVDQATGLQIELHWRLFLNAHAMAEASVMAESRVVPLTGSTGLRTMGDDDLFAYLCMHGALHWWNRLKWVADVNALLASRPGDEIERLVRAAETRGVGRAAGQALLLCRRLLGATLPAGLTDTVDKSATLGWLEATALNAMTTGQGEHHPHEVRFGTTRGTLSTFLLSRSWRYRLAELRVHLINQTDMLSVPLPERLRFLYPILRLPLWLWRHAAKHGARR